MKKVILLVVGLTTVVGFFVVITFTIKDSNINNSNNKYESFVVEEKTAGYEDLSDSSNSEDTSTNVETEIETETILSDNGKPIDEDKIDSAVFKIAGEMELGNPIWYNLNSEPEGYYLTVKDMISEIEYKLVLGNDYNLVSFEIK